MKTSETFTNTIEQAMQKMASQDAEFKKCFESKSKNIKDCVTYILNTVKKSGVNGFTDDEVYSMAREYYETEKIDVGKDISARVVVNHTVELSAEEIEKAKEDARKTVFNEQKAKMQKKKPVKSVVKLDEQPKEKVKSIPGEQVSLF